MMRVLMPLGSLLSVLYVDSRDNLVLIDDRRSLLKLEFYAYFRCLGSMVDPITQPQVLHRCPRSGESDAFRSARTMNYLLLLP